MAQSNNYCLACLRGNHFNREVCLESQTCKQCQEVHHEELACPPKVNCFKSGFSNDGENALGQESFRYSNMKSLKTRIVPAEYQPTVQHPREAKKNLDMEVRNLRKRVERYAQGWNLDNDVTDEEFTSQAAEAINKVKHVLHFIRLE